MVTHMGPVQVRLLDRAARSRVRWILPSGYLERRALRRLQLRGLAAPVPSYPDVWHVKEPSDGTA